MRELTDKEKYIVKGLFDRKNNFKLEELRTTKLLRDNLDCFALRWELAQRKRIKIYMKKEDAEDITELNKQYFKICDFLYFMNELEENHYIESRQYHLLMIPLNWRNKHYTIPQNINMAFPKILNILEILIAFMK